MGKKAYAVVKKLLTNCLILHQPTNQPTNQPHFLTSK